MGVVATLATGLMTRRTTSDLEMKIQMIQNKRLEIMYQAQYAAGDQYMLNYLHQMDVQLEQQIQRFTAMYNAFKTRLDGDDKLLKNANDRSFKLNI